MDAEEAVAFEAPPNELFYTEGTERLLTARQAIARFSLKRAKQRVESQRRRMEDLDEDEAAVAEEVESTCKKLANQCSELGDDRPIQSCAFSPDGSLLAAAGERLMNPAILGPHPRASPCGHVFSRHPRLAATDSQQAEPVDLAGPLAPHDR